MRTSTFQTNNHSLVIAFLLGLILAILGCLLYNCVCPTPSSTTIARSNSNSVNKFIVYSSTDFKNRLLTAIIAEGLIENQDEIECFNMSNINNLVGLYIKPDTIGYKEVTVGLDNNNEPITIQDPLLSFSGNLVILDPQGNEFVSTHSILLNNTGLSIAELSVGEDIIVIIEESGNNGISGRHLQFFENLAPLERAFIGFHDLVQIFCNSSFIGISGSKISVGRHEVIDPFGEIQELPEEPSDYFTLKFTGFNDASLLVDGITKSQLNYVNNYAINSNLTIDSFQFLRFTSRKPDTNTLKKSNPNLQESKSINPHEIPGETFATPCPRRWYNTN